MKQKVPVQKGEIVADVHTMKHMPVPERARQDAEAGMQRRDGQSLKYQTPKK